MIRSIVNTLPSLIKVDLRARTLSWLLFGLIISSACTPQASTPGPNTLSGRMGSAGYSLHRWDQGLSVAIVHDAPTALFCEGAGSSSDRDYILECQADSEAGSSFSWVIRTEAGEEPEITIGDRQFRLATDTLFLVHTSAAPPSIEKIERDLSGVNFEHDAFLTLAEIDPEIQAFIRSLK